MAPLLDMGLDVPNFVKVKWLCHCVATQRWILVDLRQLSVGASRQLSHELFTGCKVGRRNRSCVISKSCLKSFEWFLIQWTSNHILSFPAFLWFCHCRGRKWSWEANNSNPKKWVVLSYTVQGSKTLTLVYYEFRDKPKTLKNLNLYLFEPSEHRLSWAFR